MGRPRTREVTRTVVGVALEHEVARRGMTRAAAGAELGITATAVAAYITGARLPTLDPRTLAAFLHHDDGRAWTVEEVLDALARDRDARRGR